MAEKPTPKTQRELSSQFVIDCSTKCTKTTIKKKQIVVLQEQEKRPSW